MIGIRSWGYQLHSTSLRKSFHGRIHNGSDDLHHQQCNDSMSTTSSYSLSFACGRVGLRVPRQRHLLRRWWRRRTVHGHAEEGRGTTIGGTACRQRTHARLYLCRCEATWGISNRSYAREPPSSVVSDVGGPSMTDGSLASASARLARRRWEIGFLVVGRRMRGRKE
jgi:hypothetical protein